MKCSKMQSIQVTETTLHATTQHVCWLLQEVQLHITVVTSFRANSIVGTWPQLYGHLVPRPRQLHML